MVDGTVLDKLHGPASMRDMHVAVGTTVAIHQPNYLPWLGYFFKIAHANKFVFLDVATYSSGSFVNRNYVKTPTGRAWLTIPVIKSGRFGQRIGEVETELMSRWADRHLTTLRSNYGRAPHFKEVITLLEPHYSVVIDKRIFLADFNIGLICSIAAYLGLQTKFLRAGELDVSGHKTELLLDICRALGATSYLAGTGAKSYQEDVRFESAGIAAVYSRFVQQPYPQLFGEFAENLSVVDVLMNCGRLGTRRLMDLEPEQS